MKIEIDQSNKIEDSGDTILGFSNGTSQSICIPFVVKQQGMKTLRQRGKTRKIALLLLFSACVFILVKDHILHIDAMIIDNEYDGHGADIRSFVYEYLQRSNISFPIKNIIIRKITKKSRAHDVVWKTNKGIRSPDKIIGFQELFEVVA